MGEEHGSAVGGKAKGILLEKLLPLEDCRRYRTLQSLRERKRWIRESEVSNGTNRKIKKKRRKVWPCFSFPPFDLLSVLPLSHPLQVSLIFPIDKPRSFLRLLDEASRETSRPHTNIRWISPSLCIARCYTIFFPSFFTFLFFDFFIFCIESVQTLVRFAYSVALCQRKRGKKSKGSEKRNNGKREYLQKGETLNKKIENLEGENRAPLSDIISVLSRATPASIETQRSKLLLHTLHRPMTMLTRSQAACPRSSLLASLPSSQHQLTTETKEEADTKQSRNRHKGKEGNNNCSGVRQMLSRDGRGASIACRAGSVTGEGAIPHEPLCVLRQHRSAVLSCAFYPTTAAPATAAEPRSTPFPAGSGNSAGGPTTTTTALRGSGVPAYLMLTGDVDGTCILWDLRVRRPVWAFEPVARCVEELMRGISPLSPAEEDSNPERRVNSETVETARQGNYTCSPHASDPTDDKRARADQGEGMEACDNEVKKKMLEGLAQEQHTRMGLRGVLSVGFFPAPLLFHTSRISFPCASTSPEGGPSPSLYQDPTFSPVSTTVVKKENGATAGVGLPQRFRLRRRGHRPTRGGVDRGGDCKDWREDEGDAPLSSQPSHSIPEAKGTTAAVGDCQKWINRKENEELLDAEGSATPGTPLLFYTQCRNRKMYIWKFLYHDGAGGDAHPQSLGQRSSTTDTIEGGSPIQLVCVLDTPQIGFCQVHCAHAYRPAVTRTRTTPSSLKGIGEEASVMDQARIRPARTTMVPIASYFAIPMEGTEDGALQVWCAEPQWVSTAARQENNCGSWDFTLHCLSARGASGSGSSPSSSPPTSGVVFRAALSRVPNSRPADGWLGSTAEHHHLTHRTLHLGSFSLANGFQGGTIMCVHLCRDAHSLAAGMESGHVVLFRYRRLDTGTSTGAASSPQQVLGVLRVFPEACTSCAWEPRLACRREASHQTVVRGSGGVAGLMAPEEETLAIGEGEGGGAGEGDGEAGRRELVYAGSAEGSLQCYQLLAPSVSSSAYTYTWHLQWSAAGIPKGVGQLGLHGDVLLAGCWDATVRLLDRRSGRIMTILPQHRESVNALGICDATTFYDEDDEDEDTCTLPNTIAVEGGEDRSVSLPSHCPPIATRTPWWMKYLRRSVNEAVTSFTFDTRCMRRPQRGQQTHPLKGMMPLHVFASASKDHAVSLWRVDLLCVGIPLSYTDKTIYLLLLKCLLTSLPPGFNREGYSAPPPPVVGRTVPRSLSEKKKEKNRFFPFVFLFGIFGFCFSLASTRSTNSETIFIFLLKGEVPFLLTPFFSICASARADRCVSLFFPSQNKGKANDLTPVVQRAPVILVFPYYSYLQCALSATAQDTFFVLFCVLFTFLLTLDKPFILLNCRSCLDRAAVVERTNKQIVHTHTQKVISYLHSFFFFTFLYLLFFFLFSLPIIFLLCILCCLPPISTLHTYFFALHPVVPVLLFNCSVFSFFFCFLFILSVIPLFEESIGKQQQKEQRQQQNQPETRHSGFAEKNTALPIPLYSTYIHFRWITHQSELTEKTIQQQTNTPHHGTSQREHSNTQRDQKEGTAVLLSCSSFSPFISFRFWKQTTDKKRDTFVLFFITPHVGIYYYLFSFLLFYYFDLVSFHFFFSVSFCFSFLCFISVPPLFYCIAKEASSPVDIRLGATIIPQPNSRPNFTGIYVCGCSCRKLSQRLHSVIIEPRNSNNTHFFFFPPYLSLQRLRCDTPFCFAPSPPSTSFRPFRQEQVISHTKPIQFAKTLQSPVDPLCIVTPRERKIKERDIYTCKY
eukprot:gene10964-7609_t